MSDWNQRVIDEFRAGDGRVGGVFEGRPLLLLHHKGARSGIERVSPLMFQDLGDKFAIFASKAGSPTNPDWYHNLVANPETSIEVAGETIAVRARVTAGTERQAIWGTQTSQWPMFAEYEAKTDREIPVIVLEPKSE